MRRSLLECLFPTLRVSAVIPSDEFIQLHAAVSTDLSLNSSFRDSPDDYQNRSYINGLKRFVMDVAINFNTRLADLLFW